MSAPDEPTAVVSDDPPLDSAEPDPDLAVEEAAERDLVDDVESSDVETTDDRPGRSWLATRWFGLERRLRGASVESWITFAVVVMACLAVLWRLRPERVFSDSTPTGGDMGAHVWGPAYLRDELLPNFRLRGWSPDWYAGFPAMQFYMVLPYLAIVLLDVVLPYGTAFKVVAVSGVVLMPAAAYTMGRLANWPFPVPALMSVAGLLFVFDFNFTIYGGNIASTLAGEFAFSISLALALVYLGLVMRSLDTGRGRGKAALALALVALCHLIPLLFAVATTIIIVAVRGMHRLPELLGARSAVLAIVSGLAVVGAMFFLTGEPLPVEERL